MPKPDVKINGLLNELQHTLDTVGVDATIKILQHARTKMNFNDDEVVAKIIYTICDDFKISFPELISTYNRGWEKKYAIGFICYYSSKVRGYKLNELSSIFKKTPSLLSKYTKLIKNIRQHHKSEKEMFNKKIQFDKFLNQ